jgi:glycosyltransferase involved in cell wall biosynthesis
MAKKQAHSYMFVLPWSIDIIGGVNEVVKGLYAEMEAEGRFVPLIMQPRGACRVQYRGRPVIPFSCWGPVHEGWPLRGIASFLFHLPFRLWALWRVLENHNVRVLNPHFPTDAAVHFALLKRLQLFRGKLILSFHLGDVQQLSEIRSRSNRLSSKVAAAAWQVICAETDIAVACSEELRRELIALDSRWAAKAVTVRNAVDVKKFAAFTVAVPQNRRPVLISVARFEERKRHDILLRAFRRVSAKLPDASLILAGASGPTSESTRNMIRSLELQDRVVIFENHPPERIPELLARARVFVLASVAEGLPLVLLEAGAASMAVVSTRASGVNEIIVDNETGRLVDVDDEPGLADAMLELLTDECKAGRLACNLYADITRRFTWERAYGEYSALV